MDYHRSFETTPKEKKTKFAYIWMQLSSEPFVALYYLLPFILVKDLHASTWQISVLVMVKPVIALFSSYWSSHLETNREKLLPNLMGAWAIARIPFLIAPFLNHVWFYIFSAAIYQLFYRAGHPAIIEILKKNLPKASMKRLFSYSYILMFAESALLGLFMSNFIKSNYHMWKVLFFFSTILSITSVLFQKRIPLSFDPPNRTKNIPLKQKILTPWKNAFTLMRTHRDFAKFQWGFMIGGIGLMLIAPAMTFYQVKILHISHSQYILARYVWMGLGIILSSSFWRKNITNLSINRIMGFILFGFALYPLALYLAILEKNFFFLAFFIYGVAQAGSTFIWNLSGTFFAGDGDSSIYSGVNVLMVGLRGLFAPALGGLLTEVIGPGAVLILGVMICCTGSVYMLKKRTLFVTDRISP